MKWSKTHQTIKVCTTYRYVWYMFWIPFAKEAHYLARVDPLTAKHFQLLFIPRSVIWCLIFTSHFSHWFYCLIQILIFYFHFSYLLLVFYIYHCWHVWYIFIRTNFIIYVYPRIMLIQWLKKGTFWKFIGRCHGLFTFIPRLASS